MSRVIIDLRDATGRLDVLEVTIHQNLVECWLTDRCRGVFDRDDLRTWLDLGIQQSGAQQSGAQQSGAQQSGAQQSGARPAADPKLLASQETIFTRTTGGDVTVSIDGAVTGWPLAVHVLVDLRSRL